MRRDLTLLTGRVHDLLVIGGGIHGACVAWDAALRGLPVALVERDKPAVLATKLRTHTQVLDERTALLVDPEPVALGDGLATLLAHPSLRSIESRAAGGRA